MKIITSVKEMKKWSRQVHCEGKTIGLVPTMGCLHEGHLNLVNASIKECEYTVVSIFINPTQFGPGEDFESYPSSIETDIETLQNIGVDALFYPDQKTLYPENFQTFVEVLDKTKYLCGKNRPHFFRGVTTIVLKLFNIVNPHTAFFGEKDRQQLEIIKTMVRDLNLEVSIIGKPIIRESDGLAMSSRNQYLSIEDRTTAITLSKALESAEAHIMQGERSAKIIRTKIRQIIEAKNTAKVDYISICDPESFSEKNKINSRTLIALAVRVGKARLIDNRIIEGV